MPLFFLFHKHSLTKAPWWFLLTADAPNVQKVEKELFHTLKYASECHILLRFWFPFRVAPFSPPFLRSSGTNVWI